MLTIAEFDAGVREAIRLLEKARHHYQTLVMMAMWFLLLWDRRLGEKCSDEMALSDARRLLQVVLARAMLGCPLAHAIRLASW